MEDDDRPPGERPTGRGRLHHDRNPIQTRSPERNPDRNAATRQPAGDPLATARRTQGPTQPMFVLVQDPSDFPPGQMPAPRSANMPGPNGEIVIPLGPWLAPGGDGRLRLEAMLHGLVLGIRPQTVEARTTGGGQGRHARSRGEIDEALEIENEVNYRGAILDDIDLERLIIEERDRTRARRNAGARNQTRGTTTAARATPASPGGAEDYELIQRGMWSEALHRQIILDERVRDRIRIWNRNHQRLNAAAQNQGTTTADGRATQVGGQDFEDEVLIIELQIFLEQLRSIVHDDPNHASTIRDHMSANQTSGPNSSSLIYRVLDGMAGVGVQIGHVPPGLAFRIIQPGPDGRVISRPVDALAAVAHDGLINGYNLVQADFIAQTRIALALHRIDARRNTPGHVFSGTPAQTRYLEGLISHHILDRMHGIATGQIVWPPNPSRGMPPRNTTVANLNALLNPRTGGRLQPQQPVNDARRTTFTSPELGPRTTQPRRDQREPPRQEIGGNLFQTAVFAENLVIRGPGHATHADPAAAENLDVNRNRNRPTQESEQFTSTVFVLSLLNDDNQLRLMIESLGIRTIRSLSNADNAAPPPRVPSRAVNAPPRFRERPTNTTPRVPERPVNAPPPVLERPANALLSVLERLANALPPVLERPINTAPSVPARPLNAPPPVLERPTHTAPRVPEELEPPAPSAEFGRYAATTPMDERIQELNDALHAAGEELRRTTEAFAEELNNEDFLGGERDRLALWRDAQFDEMDGREEQEEAQRRLDERLSAVNASISLGAAQRAQAQAGNANATAGAPTGNANATVGAPTGNANATAGAPAINAVPAARRNTYQMIVGNGVDPMDPMAAFRPPNRRTRRPQAQNVSAPQVQQVRASVIQRVRAPEIQRVRAPEIQGVVADQAQLHAVGGPEHLSPQRGVALIHQLARIRQPWVNGVRTPIDHLINARGEILVNRDEQSIDYILNTLDRRLMRDLAIIDDPVRRRHSAWAGMTYEQAIINLLDIYNAEQHLANGRVLPQRLHNVPARIISQSNQHNRLATWIAHGRNPEMQAAMRVAINYADDNPQLNNMTIRQLHAVILSIYEMRERRIAEARTPRAAERAVVGDPRFARVLPAMNVNLMDELERLAEVRRNRPQRAVARPNGPNPLILNERNRLAQVVTGRTAPPDPRTPVNPLFGFPQNEPAPPPRPGPRRGGVSGLYMDNATPDPNAASRRPQTRRAYRPAAPPPPRPPTQLEIAREALKDFAGMAPVKPCTCCNKPGSILSNIFKQCEKGEHFTNFGRQREKVPDWFSKYRKGCQEMVAKAKTDEEKATEEAKKKAEGGEGGEEEKKAVEEAKKKAAEEAKKRVFDMWDRQGDDMLSKLKPKKDDEEKKKKDEEAKKKAAEEAKKKAAEEAKQAVFAMWDKQGDDMLNQLNNFNPKPKAEEKKKDGDDDREGEGGAGGAAPLV